MATLTVYLTPAELRACVADRASSNIIGRRTRPVGSPVWVDVYDEKVEIVQTADGPAAMVTFADKTSPPAERGTCWNCACPLPCGC